MTIEVEGPGGVIVEFPDGTSRQTIQAAMKAKFPPSGSMARSSNPVVSYVGRDADKREAKYRAGQDRGRQARANPAPLGSRIGGDLIEPGKEAAKKIGGAYASEAEMSRTRVAEGRYFPTLGEIGQGYKNDLNTLGGAIGLVFSPLTGPVNALTGMAARGAERLGLGDEQTNKEVLNTAMMGARPAPGAAPYNALQARPAPPSPAARTIARRGRVDVPATRERVADMRASGVQPNLTAVAGDRGQRLVRAVGATNPAAGEALTARAQTSAATTKPAVMDRARRVVSDPRTAEKYLDDLVTARDEAASANYAEPYSLEINITPETARALSGPAGEAAIDRAIQAAATSQDYHLVAELRRLKSATRMETLPGQTKQTGYNTMTAAEPPLAPVSGAALDRVQIALRKTAEGLDKTDQSDIARGLWKRRAQVNSELDNFEGLADARADYRNKSQAIGVLDKEGRDFLTTAPADYQAWLQTLGPEAIEANQIAIRQQILDRLGRQRPNSYGAIEEMVSSEYGQQNLRAALGAEGEGLIANAQARLAQTRADQVAAPAGGSRSAILTGDMDAANNAERAAQVVGNTFSGRFAAAARNIMDWARTRGIPDDVAQEITRRASDPAELDALLSEIEAALGPSGIQEFLGLVSRPEVAVPALQSGAALQGQ